MMDLNNYLKQKKQEVDSELKKLLPQSNFLLSRAMRHSALAGGKRFRAILVMAAAEAVGAPPERGIPAGCAIELLHTFSLIHDDLPAMDDDDLRRGKPTCHVKFGEAQAILAGDALFALAFEVLAGMSEVKGIDKDSLLDVISTISKAIGSEGMCLGQSADLLNEGKKTPFKALRSIHKNKTGRLIDASVYSGGRMAGASVKQLRALLRYSESLGLAFQIKDDILDLSGSAKELGKTPGKDKKSKKVTYPSLLGMEKAKKMLQSEKVKALKALQPFGKKAGVLRALAEFVVERRS